MADAPARRPGTLAGPDLVALAAIFALAAAFRVREALRAPLWYDELYSHAAVMRPWHAMLAVMRADVHPPLSFVMPWVWRVFGDSDLAVRSLSLLCGIGALVLTFALVREWFGRGAAFIATLLLALHPWHIYVSQEARSYPQLWLALTASALAAWRWLERGRRADAASFVFASAVALWTHYLAGLVLLVQWLWGLARLRREPRRLGQWLGLHVAIGVLFAPVLPLLWRQFHRVETDHWMQRPGPGDLLDLARRFAFSSAWLILPLGALAVWGLAAPRTRRAASFALALGPLCVALCWVLGTAGVRLFGVKYMLFALPTVFALVAAGIVALPGRWTPWVVAGLLALFAARAAFERPPYPEAEGLGRARLLLRSRVQPGDVFFHADSHTWLFASRYFPQARQRLLLMGQRFPYYEGGHMIADSVRGDAGELREAAAGGYRWWAMAARPAGLDVRAASALFDSLAPESAARLGVVKVWAGAANAASR